MPSICQAPSVMAETPTSARSRLEVARKRRREEHSPTSFTPEAKERRAGASKQLFPTVEENASVVGLKSEPWTNAETKALLEFLVIHENVGTFPGKWGRRGDKQFWQEAVSFVKLRSSTSCSRTG